MSNAQKHGNDPNGSQRVIDELTAVIGGTAQQLRTTPSVTGTVEEGGVVNFSLGLIDIDSGVVLAADIDITGISAILYKSTGGGAFSAAGITQPTFVKSTGLISCDYSFLVAQWKNGDIYKLVLSGITATIDGDTAYVNPVTWSSVLQEAANVEAKIDAGFLAGAKEATLGSPAGASVSADIAALKTEVETTTINSGIGIANAYTRAGLLLRYCVDQIANLLTRTAVPSPDNISSAYLGQTIGQKNDTSSATPDATMSIFRWIKSIWTKLVATKDAVDVVDGLLDAPAADSSLKATVAQTLGSKDDTFTLGVDTPDATYSIIRWNKAIFAVLTFFNERADDDDAGNTYTKDVIGSKTDTIAGTSIVALEKQLLASIDQVFVKSITVAANAGATTIGTVVTQACLVDAVIVRADAAQTADLTNAPVTAGAAGVLELIPAADILQADLNATGKQVAWQSAGKSIYLAVGETIVITPAGTGATALDLTVIIKYRPCVAGGYLA
jgi:hypothetical protein